MQSLLPFEAERKWCFNRKSTYRWSMRSIRCFSIFVQWKYAHRWMVKEYGKPEREGNVLNQSDQLAELLSSATVISGSSRSFVTTTISQSSSSGFETSPLSSRNDSVSSLSSLRWRNSRLTEKPKNMQMVLGGKRTKSCHTSKQNDIGITLIARNLRWNIVEQTDEKRQPLTLLNIYDEIHGVRWKRKW